MIALEQRDRLHVRGVREHVEHPGCGETNYVSATLTLYVSIYNLFSSLLQLLGIFGGNRD